MSVTIHERALLKRSLLATANDLAPAYLALSAPFPGVRHQDNPARVRRYFADDRQRRGGGKLDRRVVSIHDL